MKETTVDVGIIGAGGYTGQELIQILADHPNLRPALVTSNQSAGQTVDSVYPALQGKTDLVFQKHDIRIPSGMPLFLAVPNDTSLELVPRLLAAGHTIVDLSGSYRLHNQDIFEKYYKLNHTSFHLLKEAVYGLPELFREKTKKARLVANPGCYTTSAIVPLYLLGELREQIEFISIDAPSGISGAGGRVEGPGFSFYGVHENYRAYKILGHQHQPEIEEYAATNLNGPLADLVFTPHLLPLFRGILTTIVIRWKSKGISTGELETRFRQAIENEPFLRFPGSPEDVELKRVQGTNFLDMGLRSEGKNTVIVSALDNLVKGAAGQAVQNMNLLLGYPETAGLLNSRE